MTIANEKEWFFESEFVIRLFELVYFDSIFQLLIQTGKKGLMLF